jgi:hypothetical protein
VNGSATTAAGRARRTGLLLLLALVLVACGGPPPPSPEEIAERGAAALDSLTSVAFEVTIEHGPAFLDASKTLNLRQAEGAIARPDRSRATARVGAGGFVVRVQFITIGERAYMTNPLSGRWEPAPPGLGYNATALFDPRHGVAAIIRATSEQRLVSQPEVDGVPTYHLAGRVATADLLVLTGGALWIGRDDSLMRRVRLREIGAAKNPITWTIVFSRHNQPVTIEPPL